VARGGGDVACLMLSRHVAATSGDTIDVDGSGTICCAAHLGASAQAWPPERRAHWWAEIGGRLQGATFREVESHLPYVAVRDGNISRRDWRGSIEAYRLAKEGAARFRADDHDDLVLMGDVMNGRNEWQNRWSSATLLVLRSSS